jgi:hypothetical protein
MTLCRPRRNFDEILGPPVEFRRVLAHCGADFGLVVQSSRFCHDARQSAARRVRTSRAFSPPIDRMGTVSLVRDNASNSLAVTGNAMEYAHPARMRPGRA